MVVVIAPDSFKGVLGARSVADAIAEGVRRTRPQASIIIVPEGQAEPSAPANGAAPRR